MASDGTTQLQRSQADRRARIMAGARTLVANGGAAALSMRKLADEAGLSVNTIYNLIGDRDAVLGALVDHGLGRLATATAHLVDAADPLEAILERTRTAVRLARQDAPSFRALALAVHEHRGQVGASSLPAMLRAEQMALPLLERARAEGALELEIDPVRLGRRLHDGFFVALESWARRRTNGPGFEDEALYSATLTLLGGASVLHRPGLFRRLIALQDRGRKPKRGQA
ncbi:MAG: TetR/AcrR family transcriptional regulator [Myxococcota bacterium]